MPSIGGWLLVFALGVGAISAEPAVAQDSSTDSISASPIWNRGLGGGFNKGVEEFGITAGAGLGMKIFGGSREHDWYLGAIQYGWMISSLEARDHWYRGNWELLGEAFGGRQFDPKSAYFFGFTPLLRYNFAPGRRWAPFIDAGAGLTDTDIRDGDLSANFEFNLQMGAGVRYFLRDDLALTLQYRFIHISDASITSPNLGVNNSTLLIGVSWFF